MGRPLLRMGSQGPAVTLLQQALNSAKSVLTKLQEDGIFGPKTRGRVVEFQQQNKLQPDGIVGDKTHLSLEELYKLIGQLILPTPPDEQAARNAVVKFARLAAAVMGWPEHLPPPPDPASQRIACRVGLGTKLNPQGDELRQGGLGLATIYGTAGHPFASSCFTLPGPHVKFFKNKPNPTTDEKNQLIPDWCGIFCLYAYKTSGLKLSSWPLRILSKNPEFEPVRQVSQVKPGDLGLISPFGGGRNHHFLVGDINGTSIKSIDGNAGIYSSIIERSYTITKTSTDKFGAFEILATQGREPVAFVTPIWNKVLKSR
ncbi:MAG: peptidoglycan-binding domain-containing protein [Pirellulales bacterium]